jgi:HPt (histidine-containing phosphotransfer) domain-containing protein
MERYVNDSTATQPAEEAFEIPGVNTKIGLTMTGGSWKNYKKTLTIYYYDAKQRITEIAQKLEEGDIGAYTTFVHALKSASASMGAHEVSAMAAALEEAAQNGNMLYISEHNDHFLKTLSDLVLAIEKVVLSDQSDEAGENDIPFLHENLEKLKIALDEMDMTAIDALMAKLDSKEWDKDLSASIENISQYVLLFEYENAINVIDGLIAKYIK